MFCCPLLKLVGNHIQFNTIKRHEHFQMHPMVLFQDHQQNTRQSYLPYLKFYEKLLSVFKRDENLRGQQVQRVQMGERLP